MTPGHQGVVATEHAFAADGRQEEAPDLLALAAEQRFVDLAEGAAYQNVRGPAEFFFDQASFDRA
ncbi:MAG: hypothetical protein OEU92_28605 [Alphaproteobacteria bacterium]|nr:hypothetical protein [Alphaproteobacteria bacterium]